MPIDPNELPVAVGRLTENQQKLLAQVVSNMMMDVRIEIPTLSPPFDVEFSEFFRDELLLHHALTDEPFTKEKFEYALVRIFTQMRLQATKAPNGNPGHDVTLNGQKFSLKTQADKNIKSDTIWISKFKELGKSNWDDSVESYEEMRDEFLAHLNNYDRILTLRALSRRPWWDYELVEIPVAVLQQAAQGTIEISKTSKATNGKPAYCTVTDKLDQEVFSLYFDGAGERKLQLKNLSKAACKVLCTWRFLPLVAGR